MQFTSSLGCRDADRDVSRPPAFAAERVHCALSVWTRQLAARRGMDRATGSGSASRRNAELVPRLPDPDQRSPRQDAEQVPRYVRDPNGTKLGGEMGLPFSVWGDESFACFLLHGLRHPSTQNRLSHHLTGVKSRYGGMPSENDPSHEPALPVPRDSGGAAVPAGDGTRQGWSDGKATPADRERS